MFSGQYMQATIYPAQNFNPVLDAEVLFGALQGCEKGVLIDILTQRCNAQRQMISEVYRGRYGRELMADLRENLSHHFEQVMVGLMYPPVLYDAHELWHAMKGEETQENRLIDILASRTNEEMYLIKEAYCMEYSSDLLQDIYNETSGHFRDTLMSLAQGIREQGYADPVRAAQDAMVLWEACQQKTGQHKTMLQMILCSRSYQQLWTVMCVRERASYFAYRLYNAIHDLGFHNKTVIQILVSRSEVDLRVIRQRYKERYGKSLYHDVKHFASGHYGSALLAILAGDVEDY
ncbi:annexin A10 isoform X2 [Amia ocellicauda]|uniref:annexin A10 isoform X2 n=1 Tax=Amia ocellicauda TaxID=2972642 RepID=UPI003464676A